ncbi:MAG: LamG domain-containing protein [Mesotoga sp.]|nr:LamG domain-containing protein [Mesotoga sp.]
MAGEQLFINRPLPGAQINHSHPLAKGLVGCWLMNEQAGIRCIDSSLYNNHGTMVGFGVPANSRSSQGVKFDGTNDYINLGNTTSLNITGPMTIEAWINTNDIVGTHEIVVKEISSADTQYSLRTTDDDLEFVIHDGSQKIAKYANIIQIGMWYHVIGMLNKSNLSVYVNGVIGSILGTIGTQTTNTEKVGIGARRPTTPSLFFNGNINKVSIYNRVLNKDEVKELYINPYAIFQR